MTKTFQQALDDAKRRRGNPPQPLTFNRGLTTYSIFTRIDMTVRRENLLTLNNWVNSVKGAVKEATLPIESSFAVGHPLKEPGTFTQPVITGIYDIYMAKLYTKMVQKSNRRKPCIYKGFIENHQKILLDFMSSLWYNIIIIRHGFRIILGTSKHRISYKRWTKVRCHQLNYHIREQLTHSQSERKHITM